MHPLGILSFAPSVSILELTVYPDDLAHLRMRTTRPQRSSKTGSIPTPVSSSSWTLLLLATIPSPLWPLFATCAQSTRLLPPPLRQTHWGQIPIYWSGKCWLNCGKMENIPSNYLLSKWWFFSEFTGLIYLQFTGSSKCLVFLQFAGSHDHHFLIG